MAGWVLFQLPTVRAVAESTEGFVALATTLLVYAVAELVHGYGFLAVFVAACVLRNHERGHEYHEVLHASAESIERLASAALLVLLGGAVVDGALEPLTVAGVAVALAVVLVVRPLAGWVSLAGTGLAARERWAIAFFGIRGIGSVYYLAHALNDAEFSQGRELWAIVSLTILLSVVIHGLSAAPVISRLDGRRAGPRRTGRTCRLLAARRGTPAGSRPVVDAAELVVAGLELAALQEVHAEAGPSSGWRSRMPASTSASPTRWRIGGVSCSTASAMASATVSAATPLVVSWWVSTLSKKSRAWG